MHLPQLSLQSQISPEDPAHRVLPLSLLCLCRHGEKHTKYKFYADEEGNPLRLHMHGNDAFSGKSSQERDAIYRMFANGNGEGCTSRSDTLSRLLRKCTLLVGNCVSSCMVYSPPTSPCRLYAQL